MTDTVVVEGQVRLREGKKWKNRWLILRKPSPVAGTGVFFLACAEGEQISFLFDCIARGISPSRAPFGLRPTLPDPGSNTFSVEARITQEACELEKRLSLLSVSSHQSSTGDDRSISSSSSDTSHSDTSMSIRLAIWPDPVRSPTPSEASVPSPGAKAPKPLNALARASSEERLYGMVMGGVCPPSKQPRPRALQEAGRQSSTDSGIATGSHSSYSGSLSSYTGSLDTAQAETDEFGSLLSLTYTSPQVPEHRRCACQVGASQRQDSEYQVPSQVPQHYDIPRRLGQLHPSTPVHAQRSQHAFLELSGTPVTAASAESGERTVPPGGFAMPRQALCPVCGGLKTVSLLPSFIVSEYAVCFTFPDRFQADSANYVNIPVSPMSKRQLNYMELDLQDMQESGYVVRGASSTKYAHIDIGATEAAQRVGAQHAQGREERLQELEQRRRGTLT
uniref:Docking protein 7 n=1 Tax=Electrophorus electricus TaxID=8005 RepID=A0AAY5EDB0_ELEEL